MKRRHFLAGTAAATTLGFPHLALAKKQRWKMVTTWPKNFPGLGTGANRLAELIAEMTQGRIRIKVYGSGELVPAMGVFDAVKRGTAQVGHGAAYYWKGKHEASQFFAAVPFGMNAMEMNAWLSRGGGQKLWDEIYHPFGIQGYAAGNTGVQMGGWFNKEIKSSKDFNGLKIRMPGLGGEVLRQTGAAVVTLPGSEIFQALKTGAIDATEWVGPYNDMATGLHTAGKFYYWPGWHEPGTTLEAIFNQKALAALSKEDRQAVRWACQIANHEMLEEYTQQNSRALSVLVEKHKVKLRRFPDTVLKDLATKSASVLNEVAAKDPKSKKVFESFSQFRKSAMSYNQITEEGYSLARKLGET